MGGIAVLELHWVALHPKYGNFAYDVATQPEMSLITEKIFGCKQRIFSDLIQCPNTEIMLLRKVRRSRGKIGPVKTLSQILPENKSLLSLNLPGN